MRTDAASSHLALTSFFDEAHEDALELQLRKRFEYACFDPRGSIVEVPPFGKHSRAMRCRSRSRVTSARQKSGRQRAQLHGVIVRP